MKKKGLLPGALVVTCALAGVGTARADVDHLWPTFSVGAGGYEITATDRIHLEGGLGQSGQRVNLETDLGLPDSKTLFQADFAWTFAENHTVDASYYSLDRDGSRATNREVVVGNVHFPVGASANVSFKSTAFEAGYTYWFVRSEKLGFGGSVGAVDLSLSVKASASANIGAAGSTVTRRADASTDLPVPMIGLSVKGSPIDRLVLYARGRFLPKISVGDYDGEAGSYGLGGYYYVAGPVALGISYDGTYYKADIDKSAWHGSIDLVDHGWRFFLRAAF